MGSIQVTRGRRKQNCDNRGLTHHRLQTNNRNNKSNYQCQCKANNYAIISSMSSLTAVDTVLPTCHLTVTNGSTGQGKSLHTSPSSRLATESVSRLTHGTGMVRSTSEMTTLQRETQNVQLELEKARESIKLLRDREKQLRDRLSDQAQKLFHMSNTRFEDLSLGDKRPTALISKYGDLYNEGRVDALDSLDALQDLTGLDDLKGKLLFSVVVLSFRSVQHSFEELRGKLRHILQLPKDVGSSDTLSKEMETHINQYLCQTTDRFDLSKNISEVTSQIHSTLFDYPGLVECEGLRKYIEDCVHLSWGLTVQSPQYVLQYDGKAFHPHYHTRFPLSDPDGVQIVGYLWPTLLEGEDGPCVQKGVVVT